MVMPLLVYNEILSSYTAAYYNHFRIMSFSITGSSIIIGMTIECMGNLPLTTSMFVKIKSWRMMTVIYLQGIFFYHILLLRSKVKAKGYTRYTKSYLITGYSSQFFF